VGSSRELSLTIYNGGSGTLVGRATRVDGSFFGISSGGYFQLESGRSATITIKFTPVTPAVHSGQLVLATNGGDATVALVGTGVASPQPSYNPPSPSVTQKPSSIQLLSPSNGASDVPITGVRFSWAAYPGASRYEFTLAKDRSLASVVQKAFIPTTSYEFVMRLDYSTEYYWQVRAIEPSVSEPSAVFTFKTGAAVAVSPRQPSSRSPDRPEIMRLFITPEDPQIKVAVDDILSGEWRWAYNDFNAMRQWVSTHVSYRHDKDVHGVDEYWQLPAETLKLKTGDCEDFAILLCTLLRAYGVPADQVYVAVGVSKQGQSAHAYLLEKWYTGIWKVVEPQADAWAWLTMGDWLTEVSYETIWCFNDQYYIKGVPELPPGVYEFELTYSFWPATRGATVTFKRYMKVGEVIKGTVEWLDASAIAYDWSLNVYDPRGSAVVTWSGKNLRYAFSFTVSNEGVYKIEILKRDYLPRSVRLTVEPQDWITR
jgi:predicted transglutaminase-like cysteine proteinase